MIFFLIFTTFGFQSSPLAKALPDYRNNFWKILEAEHGVLLEKHIQNALIAEGFDNPLAIRFMHIENKPFPYDKVVEKLRSKEYLQTIPSSELKNYYGF